MNRTDSKHYKHCFLKDIMKRSKKISCGVFLRVGNAKLYMFSTNQSILKFFLLNAT